MKTLFMAAIVGCGLLAAPAASIAAPADATQMAQFDPRFGGDRDSERPREFRREDRGDRDFRGDRDRRFERRRERCHVEIVRRRTPFGVRLERVRRCG